MIEGQRESEPTSEGVSEHCNSADLTPQRSVKKTRTKSLQESNGSYAHVPPSTYSGYQRVFVILLLPGAVISE